MPTRPSQCPSQLRRALLDGQALAGSTLLAPAGHAADAWAAKPI